jgi:uncharacterized protein YaiI (UPF0178 family)
MTKIYVDGDACPVKDEIFKVAARHHIPVYFVANQWLRLPQSDLFNMMLAPSGPDEADKMIVEHIQPYDICITADIPLADYCVKKGAFVLNHTGKTLNEDNIGMALAGRDLMTHLRETSDIGHGGNKPFSQKDRSSFLNALDVQIQKAKKS